MSRNKAAQQEVDEATLPIIPGRRTRAVRQQLLDPQAPMPGAMKRVGETPAAVSERRKQKADPKHLRDRFALYCRELARNAGDPVPALAVVFDLPIEDARLRATELHQEITRAVNMMNSKDLFDMNGISKAHRMMRLREIFYSDNLAGVLKATDMLDEMDSHAKSSGDSWEDMIASVTFKPR